MKSTSGSKCFSPSLPASLSLSFFFLFFFSPSGLRRTKIFNVIPAQDVENIFPIGWTRRVLTYETVIGEQTVLDGNSWSRPNHRSVGQRGRR